MKLNKKRNAARPSRYAKADRLYGDQLSFAATEAYKLLRTNLFFCRPAGDDRECPVVGITSSVQGEGKSTTSINLAYMIAESGRKVCLIEADLRAPTYNSRLKLKTKEGLSHVLTGMSTTPQAIFTSALHPNLKVVPAGVIPPNPVELLGSERMVQFVDLLKKHYEYIIFDLPPITIVADALAISGVLDGMIVVVEEGVTTKRQLNDSMQRMEIIQDKILGFVITRADSSDRKYGKKYGRGYGNGYGYKSRES